MRAVSESDWPDGEPAWWGIDLSQGTSQTVCRCGVASIHGAEGGYTLNSHWRFNEQQRRRDIQNSAGGKHFFEGEAAAFEEIAEGVNPNVSFPANLGVGVAQQNQNDFEVNPHTRHIVPDIDQTYFSNKILDPTITKNSDNCNQSFRTGDFQ